MILRKELRNEKLKTVRSLTSPQVLLGSASTHQIPSESLHDLPSGFLHITCFADNAMRFHCFS
jgi:hypothetical protein